ncbi:hypothetical protein A5661_15790 [Mycobacterium asiaticum]|nr:hypothetical protein A5661_15790 [Mycobacterium asiaticum]
MTKAERRLRAQHAVNTRWAREPDRQAATRRMREGTIRRFEKQVDPDGTLPDDVRAKLAENARLAELQRMALRSATARRARRKAAASEAGTGDQDGAA